MLRRNFLAAGSAASVRLAFGGRAKRHASEVDSCACAPLQAVAGLPDAFTNVHSGVKITGIKIFGVSLTPTSDRP